MEGASDRFSSFSATKVEARTTSSVVTPKSLKQGSVRITHVIMGVCPIAPLRVENTVLFEDFGDNWNGGVDRVRDHEDESLWATQGDSGSKIADDTSVDLMNEKVSILVGTERDR